ncbi:hypothetical protein GGQ97_002341 [Sphingomonas kaistensis]|uniref:Uncharacterized protein n=1 Tax=Sphingomonas kaistensis TaxID=298708 RepID=A0A7X6BH39_9SPHN|nr:hypothetical protein [Sphingomonas kaistensis]NJC06548.1 hypothetical protein [Sphingomonas kaistensis]
MSQVTEAIAAAIYERAQLFNGNLSALPWALVQDKDRWIASADAAVEAMSSASPPVEQSEGVATGYEQLKEALKPYEHHHGPLPDFDSPVAGVFDAGVQFAVELLAKELGVADWTPCEGTEEYEGDLGGTLINIVLAAMPKDEHGDAMHPSEVRAALTPPPVTVSVEEVRAELERQMEGQDETLPSSIARDRGLTWLEGWFDLPAALKEGHSLSTLSGDPAAGYCAIRDLAGSSSND